MALDTILIGLASSSAVAIIVTLLVTLTTRFRLWPPGDDGRKAVLHWGLVAVFDVSFVGVAVLRWNTWLLPRPSSLVIGVILSVCGAVLFGLSAREMSGAETTGRTAADLHTDGLYARSRNPQYVGMIVGVVGFVCLANSLSVAVLGVLYVSWLVILPFAEEPWLRDHFGAEYDRYCDRVPRFVGLRTFRRN